MSIAVPLTKDSHVHRKKRKLESKQERLQCEFFIPQKSRHCSMTRRSDSRFCAEHSTDSLEDRVPCPKDPSHSVWTKNLSKHLKKCNANKEQVVRDVCFEENLNWEADVCGPETEKISLQDNRDDFVKFIKHLETKCKEFAFENDLPLEDSYDKEDALNSRFEELTNQKHIIQQSSIISHLKKLGITSDKSLIIEFGCGKAELSRYVNKFLISQNKFPDFLLIDRSSPRLKYDTKFAKDYKEMSSEEFPSRVTRYKIDIKDLALDKAIEEERKLDKIYGISKHLCGVATDLTLRCCLNSNIFQKKKGAIVIAMCCRHCCNYDQLLPDSKKFLDQLSIDKFKFNNYLIKLTSWATCGRREGTEESNEHFTGLGYDERLAVGLKARRIIDECRKYAMAQQGYKVRICKYVESEVSLENHLMIMEKTTGS